MPHDLFELLAQPLLGPPKRDFLARYAAAFAGAPAGGGRPPETVSETEAKSDFDRLFLIPSDSLLVARESVYRRAPARGADGKRFGGPDHDVVFSVCRIYDHFEFHVPDRFSCFADHAGVELMFLHCLQAGENAALTRGDETEAGRWALWSDRFRREHCDGWLSGLGDDLRRSAQTGFYRFHGAVLQESFAGRRAGG